MHQYSGLSVNRESEMTLTLTVFGLNDRSRYDVTCENLDAVAMQLPVTSISLYLIIIFIILEYSSFLM